MADIIKRVYPGKSYGAKPKASKGKQVVAKKDDSQKGAAQINIELRNSEIIVRHTNQKGDILFKKKAKNGDWDKIWAAIKK